MFCAGLLLEWFRCPAAVGAQGYNIAAGVHVGFRSPWLAPAVRAQCLAITRNKTPRLTHRTAADGRGGGSYLTHTPTDGI